MKQSLWALIALVLCGCTSGFLPFKTAHPPTNEQTSTDGTESHQGQSSQEMLLNPRRSMDELLVQRLSLCGEAEEDRTSAMRDLDITAHEENGVDELTLNRLLLASCSPAESPGVLNQLLADLTTAGTWPEEYAAFFDLLITGQRAYAAVEKVYLELKTEHEKTIQGLSEIEAQIELHSVETSP